MHISDYVILIKHYFILEKAIMLECSLVMVQ